MIQLGGLIFLGLLMAMPCWGGETIKLRLRRAQSQVVVTSSGLTVTGNNVELGRGQTLESVTIKRIQESGKSAVWRVVERDNGQVHRISGSKLTLSGQSLRIRSKLVPSEIEFVAAPELHFDILAHLDLERYLLGVLPSEMPGSWHMEALKAQAVASRSYAMRLKRERSALSYHLEATIFDQVYSLSNHYRAPARIRKRLAQAIKETEGVYLIDRRARPLHAYYHADCGGMTEEPFRVWDNNESIGIVKDSMCPLSPLGRWKLDLQREQVEEAFAAYFKGDTISGLRIIRVVSHSPSGRVQEVEFEYLTGEKHRVDSNRFRQQLGFSNVKSAKFLLKWTGDSLLIEGEGHGHGVGMCQYGARLLAKRGMNYLGILKHYYPQAAVVGGPEEPLMDLPQATSPMSIRKKKKATAPTANKFM